MGRRGKTQLLSDIKRALPKILSEIKEVTYDLLLRDMLLDFKNDLILKTYKR